MSKVNWNQNGYVDQSMSKKAQEAYDYGEMPKSKWTKKAMLETIANYIDMLDIDEQCLMIFNNITKEKLFDQFFEYKSWHHTGKFANVTEFYGLSESWLCCKLTENGYGLDIFVNDENWRIRNAVAKYGRVKDLDILVNDENEYVRSSVLTHKRNKDIEILRFDNSPYVQIKLINLGIDLDRFIDDKSLGLCAHINDKSATISEYAQYIKNKQNPNVDIGKGKKRVQTQKPTKSQDNKPVKEKNIDGDGHKR